MSYAIEILGIFLVIVGCITSTVAKDEGRKGWRAFGLLLTGVGAAVVLNF